MENNILKYLRSKYPPEQIVKFIDATLLKPSISFDEVQKLINDVKRFGFYCAMVPPTMVLESEIFDLSGVKVCSVVGFPYGYHPLKVKAEEAKILIDRGSEEIDVVINLVNVINNRWDDIEMELKSLREIEKEFDVLVKVIVEAPLLHNNALERVISEVARAGLSYVKTSTGVISKGGDFGTVLRVSNIAKKYGLKVKAAGGIKGWLGAALALYAGASRIGMSDYLSVIEDKRG